MREKDSPSLDQSHRTFVSHGSSTSMVSSEKGTFNGVASMWHEVVTRLERSVNNDLVSDESGDVLRAIQCLRQFAVASTMNKMVVGNSTVLRPRLLQLLSRFLWWSSREKKVCADLCGLINSLVRDCTTLSDHILSRPDILDQLIKVILDAETDARLREITLLLLRSLFGAEELSAVLSTPPSIPSQKTAAVTLFTDATLNQLMALIRVRDETVSPLSTTTFFIPPSSAHSDLTNTARCCLMELLALLATDSGLARRLHRLGVLQLCHQVISSIACKHSNSSVSPYSSATASPTKETLNRVACARATDPANQLAARFALKLMTHILFHVEDALDVFKTIYQETDPFKLVACYSHLTGVVPPSEPRVCHELPTSCRSRLFSQTPTHGKSTDVSANYQEVGAESPTNSQHCTIPVSSCVPTAHGTQAFLGLVRGLIYWRLSNTACKLNRSVEALDQFGNHVTSAKGIGMSSDDVALLVIQPLTDGLLCIEDTRILSWICHVLVLVLGQQADLHMWTVYTNSFVREMDSRVTSLIKAVQAALDGRNHVQFIEHLIPMVKLFACLTSASESIRVLFSDLTLCGKLIEFAVHLRSLGAEHSNLVLEFQHSIAILLHVLSRSFSAHHSFFRHESCIRYLLQLITDNLPAACRGHSLCAGVVEAASCALVNILLPRSPLRQDSHPLMDSCLNVLIRLITVTASVRSASPSSTTATPTSSTWIETTADLRVHHTFSPGELRVLLLRLRLNGIWGLVNLLHDASAATCTQVFQQLVTDDVWLDMLRPVASQSTGWTNTRSTPTPVATRRCSTGSVYRHQTSESKANKLRTRSMIVPETSIRDPMFYPPASVTPPHERASCIPIPAFATRAKRASLDRSIVPGGDSDSQATNLDIQLHHLLLHKTLMFLRNLLRHEKVIDSIVKEHWWNITQLLISVLEGDHPQPVKEQAVLVLAHLANGHSARKELHRNGDLIEKLKLFMRSSDSHIKSAALTATYNLLGLGRDDVDSDGLFGSSRTHSDPFLSHQWRLHHRHHRHKDRHRRKPEAHNLSTSRQSSGGPSARRDVVTCVAQSALQEAEEELEEEEEEQDIVLEHAVVSEESAMQLHGALESVSYGSMQTEQVGTVEDSTVSFAMDEAERFRSNAVPSNRHHSYRRWWQLSPASATQANEIESTSLSMAAPGTVQSGYLSTDAAIRSLSISSTSSSTSSTSCAEDLTSTVIQGTELGHSAAQDVCAMSSTSCSEAELNVTSSVTDLPQTHDDATMIDALVLDVHAPLASQEAADETGSQSVQLTQIYSTDFTTQTTNTSATGNALDYSSQSRWTESSGVRKDRLNSPLFSRRQPWSSSIRQQLVCPRRSRRDLETGFRQILLPFLQELESDQLLRNTWDWLMLRANTRGKPVQLHQLFVAWQRLYNTLPSGSLPHTISDTLNIESTLFSNCVTVDAFLKRLKDSSNPTCSSSLLAAIPRHRDGRRHRRRHHHCHRHQTQGHESAASIAEDSSTSTPIPPVLTSEELERTDDLLSDEQNR